MNFQVHDYVLQHLNDCKGEWPTVAKECGMSKRTIEKIARREIPNPGILSIERLARYFVGRRQIKKT